MAASIFSALKYIPASTARKALEKVNPGFKNFFASAVAYGVDVNHAIDFLSDRFESDAQKQRKRQLEEGAANKTLRPDELASRSQLANQELPAKILKGAASAALGGSLAGRGKHPAEEKEAGISVQPSSSAHIRSQREHGPFEQGPEQGVMGPLREGHEPRYAMGPNPQPQHPQHPRGEREQALNLHAEMSKMRNNIKQLKQQLSQEEQNFKQQFGDPEAFEPIPSPVQRLQKKKEGVSELLKSGIQSLNILLGKNG